MAEQGTLNPLVPGSSPGALTIILVFYFIHVYTVRYRCYFFLLGFLIFYLRLFPKKKFLKKLEPGTVYLGRYTLPGKLCSSGVYSVQICCLSFVFLHFFSRSYFSMYFDLGVIQQWVFLFKLLGFLWL